MISSADFIEIRLMGMIVTLLELSSDRHVVLIVLRLLRWLNVIVRNKALLEMLLERWHLRLLVCSPLHVLLAFPVPAIASLGSLIISVTK